MLPGASHKIPSYGVLLPFVQGTEAIEAILGRFATLSREQIRTRNEWHVVLTGVIIPGWGRSSTGSGSCCLPPLKLAGYTVRPSDKRKEEHVTQSVSSKVRGFKSNGRTLAFSDPVDLDGVPRTGCLWVEHFGIAAFDLTRVGGLNTNSVDRLAWDVSRFSEKCIRLVLLTFARAADISGD